MKYTVMPMGMWYLFRKSFRDNLVAILKYDQETADAITAKAKWKYRSIIEKLPEFEKEDRFLMNIVNCAMLSAFILSMPEHPAVEMLTDYYAESMMIEPMKLFCRLQGRNKFSPEDLKEMRETAKMKAADRNPYSWNMDLYEYKDPGTHQLSPWALMWDDEMYYLVVYDAKHSMVTHYRVDKMKEITILDDVREGKEAFKEFNLADYTKSLFGMYAGEETKVTLEGENYMAGVLIDRFGKDIIFAPIDEKHFRTTVTVAVSTHFLGWIVSLGGGIKVTGPDNVVEQMKDLIIQLNGQYDI